MTCWQVATCTVTLQAPHPIVAAAAPLFALYPRIKPAVESDICFMGSQTTNTQENDDRWSIHCNGTLLWQDADIGNIIAALELALYRRVVAAIAPELCSIHATAIAIDRRVIVCAGVSGAGKSSLCTQALLTGAHYLSDEFALLADDGNIHPFPRPLQWEHLNHPAFSHDTMMQSNLFNRGEYQFKDPHGASKVSQLWLPRQTQQTTAPLHMLILPRFVAESPTQITPITRSAAIIQLADLLHQHNSVKHNIQLLHHRIPPDCRLYSMRFGSVEHAWTQLIQLL